MTTKILALTDALGNPADFRLLPGQAHDLRGVPDLLDGLDANHILADRAFDADWLRDALSQREIAPVIPPRKNRKQPAAYDEEMYKWQHLVENFFQKIKDNRGVATRYCKTDTRQTLAMPHSYLSQQPSCGSNERQQILVQMIAD